MKVTFQPKTMVQTIILSVLLFTAQNAAAQGTRSDYERANNLRKATANKVFRQRVTPNWLEDNVRFWYRNDLSEEKHEFILVNAETGVRQAAFDHKRLAAALSKATEQKVPADRLPIDKLEFTESASELLFTSEGKKFKCDIHNYKLEQVSEDTATTGSLEPGVRVRPSVRTGDETSITFFNRTSGTVEIYWIDSGRQRRHYASVSAGEQHRQHTYAGHVWLVTDEAGKRGAVFTAGEEPGKALIDEKSLRENIGRSRSNRRSGRRQAKSPDGKWSGFVKDYNLYVRNIEDDSEIKLSEDGTEEDSYEERLYWSPDSKKLVVMRVRQGNDRKIHFVESSPKDELQPILHTFSYRKPGDPIDAPKPQLFEVHSKRRIAISDELFPNPWSISRLHWFPDSNSFSFLYNQRGHQVLRIISVDADTGRARSVIDEQSKTFIDYAGKQYSQYIDDANEIIWMSERDGWNHLYLFDAETGKSPKASGSCAASSAWTKPNDKSGFVSAASGRDRIHTTCISVA